MNKIGSLDAKFKDPVFRRDNPQIVAASLHQTLRLPVRLEFEADTEGYPAGTVLARRPSNGLFTSYEDGQADGKGTAVAVLLNDVIPASGDTDLGIGIFKGTLYEDNLTGLDAAAKVDLGSRTIQDATGVKLLVF